MALKNPKNIGKRFSGSSFASEFGDLTRYKKSLRPHTRKVAEIIKGKSSYQTALKRKGLSDSQIAEIVGESQKSIMAEGGRMSNFAARRMRKFLGEHYSKEAIESAQKAIAQEEKAIPKSKKVMQRRGLLAGILHKKEEEKPPVARHLRALDTSFEDERSRTDVTFKRIRGKSSGGTASRLEVDISKSGAPESSVDPLSGRATSFKRRISGPEVGASGLSSGKTTSPVGGSLKPPSAPSAPPKMPPKLAV